MKRFVSTLSMVAAAACMMMWFSPVQAQLNLPAPSPHASVSQDVGMSNIMVEYSSPGVKEREIWGGLVPFGEMWRTGANEATKITFKTDAMVGDQNWKPEAIPFLPFPRKTSGP